MNLRLHWLLALPHHNYVTEHHEDATITSVILSQLFTFLVSVPVPAFPCFPVAPVFVEKCSMGMCSSWVHCTNCVGCLSSGISYIYIYGTLHHFVRVSLDKQWSIHFCYVKTVCTKLSCCSRISLHVPE